MNAKTCIVLCALIFVPFCFCSSQYIPTNENTRETFSIVESQDQGEKKTSERQQKSLTLPFCCRPKKRYHFSIGISLFVGASLLLLLLIHNHISNKQRKLLLEKCNEYVETDVACPAVISMHIPSKNLYLHRFNHIFEYNEVAEAENYPMCVSKEAGDMTVADWEKRRTHIIDRIIKLALLKRISPIEKYARNNYMFSKKTIPTIKEIKNIAELFKRIGRVSSNPLLEIIMNLFDPSKYLASANLTTTPIIQKCWPAST